jgi:antitoxin CptB
MAVQETAGEHIAMRRKRLRYRAWHRGTREMDLVLGPFADAHVERYDTAELDRLEALMEEQDTDLLKWVMGQEPAPETVDKAFLALVVADHQERVGR